MSVLFLLTLGKVCQVQSERKVKENRLAGGLVGISMGYARQEHYPSKIPKESGSLTYLLTIGTPIIEVI